MSKLEHAVAIASYKQYPWSNMRRIIALRLMQNEVSREGGGCELSGQVIKYSEKSS